MSDKNNVAEYDDLLYCREKIMTKKNNQPNTTPNRRQTRREYMLSQKEQEQFRSLRLALFGLIGLVGAILLIGLAWEFLVKPGQPVAEVGDTKIAMNDWQDRASFERNRVLSSLDDFYTAVGGDLNQLYQFAGYQMQLAQIPAALGRQVLDQMIDEELLDQEAGRRGIAVSDADIEAEIEEQFNFYDGGLPTATPESTQTPVPTPSVTPISQNGEEAAAEEEEAEPTEEPTALPTATPVTQESYNEQYDELITTYEEWGGGDTDFRRETRYTLLREKLQEAFAGEGEITLEQENYSLFSMVFQTEAEAETALTQIEAEDFLTAWNTTRSAERTTAEQPFASELQWTPLETISNSFGADVNDFLLTADIDETSDVISGGEDSGRWFIINLRGREVQPIDEAGIEQQKAELLNEWLTEERQSALIYESRYEENSPSRPLLDRKFFDTGAAPADDSITGP